MKIKRDAMPQVVLFVFLSAILLYFFTFTTAVLAEEMPNVIGVRLTDGSVIEGTVIKANTDIVTIRTKDGQIVTRKFSDVDNFIKTGESLAPSPKTRYEESPFYAGVFGGYVIPNKVKAEGLGLSADIDIDNGGMVGIKLGANIPSAPYCNLEVEYFRIINHDIPSQTFYNAGSVNAQVWGNINVSNLMFNLMIRYPVGNLRPYLGAGIGWSHFDASGSGSIHVGSTTYTYPSDSGMADSFAFQAMVGLNYRLDRYFSIDGGYRYFITKPSYSNVDFTYQAQMLTLGLNYHFW
jgi:opacity protein-like surface antigen